MTQGIEDFFIAQDEDQAWSEARALLRKKEVRVTGIYLDDRLMFSESQVRIRLQGPSDSAVLESPFPMKDVQDIHFHFGHNTLVLAQIIRLGRSGYMATCSKLLSENAGTVQNFLTTLPCPSRGGAKEAFQEIILYISGLIQSGELQGVSLEEVSNPDGCNLLSSSEQRELLGEQVLVSES